MKLLIATGNPSKLREMREVLSKAVGSLRPHLEWVGLESLASAPPEPEETGSTFLENATLKAIYYSRATAMPALADDSGLEVDALGGAPGVASAYYDERFADRPRAERDAANNARLISRISAIPPDRRTARYRCVLVLADGERVLATADGSLEGMIVTEPRGAGGFGYDPYFYLPAYGQTVAQLSADEKNAISHRGVALRRMCEKLASLPTAAWQARVE
ncbi:MAG: non-canonical purine NTP pyrophosphatase [Phycisphaerae bacterium]|nr:MAG: RdgB/HAM1 family non-canonical purine NTP pyrophosphatase [Planctomycetia bacterium]RIK70502.1 MAG: non-canonical purine NTP pyrophosphatase, RdgB/HAM1 family [Planctomycetota bacterium]GJQ26172.1 MAG: non-canonical purine NTP pyrophosphatase [Phycisphaerae bacterium]